jgi:hypothetical protein
MGPPPVPCSARRGGAARGGAPAWATIAVLVAGLLGAADARAGDDEELQAAMTRVEAQKFPEAIARLEVLLDPQAAPCPSDPELTPSGCRLTNPELIVAARAQYALALFGEKGRTPEVYAQAEAILRAQPTYQPNTSLFPQDLVDVFVVVRGRLAEENVEAARKKADAAQRQKEQEDARKKAEAEYIAALEKQAAEENVLLERSRLYAFVPFGVGQYQNEDYGLMAGFAAFEAIAGITSLVTFLYEEDLEAQSANPQVDPDAAKAQIEGWALANRIAFGVLVGSAVIGVVEANVSYEAAKPQTRQRPLPKRKAATTVTPIVMPAQGGGYLGAVGTF